jgi:NAD(P)-dependent dehydrogenase (short-subunit alcohol dehydrogenase family)
MLTETQRLVRRGRGGDVHCDVRDEARVSAAENVVKRFGAAHILVNNAGTAIRKKIRSSPSTNGAR